MSSCDVGKPNRFVNNLFMDLLLQMSFFLFISWNHLLVVVTVSFHRNKKNPFMPPVSAALSMSRWCCVEYVDWWTRLRACYEQCNKNNSFVPFAPRNVALSSFIKQRPDSSRKIFEQFTMFLNAKKVSFWWLHVRFFPNRPMAFQQIIAGNLLLGSHAMF